MSGTVIMYVVIFLVIISIGYYFVQRRNFRDTAAAILSKKGFPEPKELYHINGSDFYIAKDISKRRIGFLINKWSTVSVSVYNDFVISNIISENGIMIAVDNNSKKTCIIRRVLSYQADVKFFDAKDIVSVEIIESTDTETKTLIKTNRGSQILGGVVGKAVLGVPGMIIGGLSGSKTSKSKTIEHIKSIVLRLTINDMQNPICNICLMNVRTKRDSFIYRKSIEQAQLWNGIFKVIIHTAQ